MIYLDHNAGAPLRPEVRARLDASLAEATGNASSVHRAGRAQRKRLDAARAAVAKSLGCGPREVIFTGSGSEAAALALLGAWRARPGGAAAKVVTSAIEHPCVLLACERLEREGAKVVRVPPEPSGRVSPERIAAELPGAALCSLAWVNNETGVIQPVAEVARACAEAGVRFHTDAVQAVGRLGATLRDCPADLLSASGHKLGAPAGIGVLVARRDVPLVPLVPGHQEGGLRGGTQSVMLAEALALALELALAEAPAERARLDGLRADFEARLGAGVPGLRVHGAEAPRAPGTSSLLFPGADGEAVLIALDLEGTCVSTGAACASGTMRPSHVLLAMGRTAAEAHASLRVSYGLGTTAAELETAAAQLIRAVAARAG